jgi:hypothetical protein
MKKTISVFFVSLLLSLSLGLMVSQSQEGGEVSETIYGIVSEDNAIVRAGPDFAYAPIDGLPLNASVVVLGRAGDFFSRWDGRQWLQIEHTSGPAWIYARLLRTSVGFNSIHPTGRVLPRDNNGRVPEGFNLSSEICSQWSWDFAVSGNFMTGDEEMVVTIPEIAGVNVYTVLVIDPINEFRTPFDSTTGTVTIELGRLPNQAGIYTLRVAPYWTNSNRRYRWQQVCLLRTIGTIEKPLTDFDRAGTVHPTRTPTAP